MQHTSPVKKYPGYIVLPEYFGWDDLIAWDENVSRAAEEQSNIKRFAFQEKAVLSVVQEWHIEGLQEKPEKLPANTAGARLIGWIVGIVSDMIMENDLPDPFLSDDPGSIS